MSLTQKNYECLLRNLARFSNVQIVEKGVWNRRGKLKLYLDPRYPVVHSVVIPPGDKFIDVDVDTLDNIASELGFNQSDFIKINVEGAELEVLQGAEHILKSASKVVIEAHHIRNGRPTYPYVCQFLKARGFETRIVEGWGTVYAWRI